MEITIDDPKVYAKPWSVTQELQLIADGELIEDICNENNLASRTWWGSNEGT